MGRRRRNPEVWEGTPKQIAWAKSIREQARPVVDAWIEDLRRRRRDTHNSPDGWSRHCGSDSRQHDIAALAGSYFITDARFWIDNRNCADADAFIAAIVRHRGRRNPGGNVNGSLLGIGTLHGLEVESGGRAKTIPTPGLWLAWEPKARRFHICKPQRQRAGAAGLSPAIKAAHRKFHSEAPRKTLVAEVPTPSGALKPLGLLKSLTYRVPSRMVLSPEKNPYAWHHAFGDTGHKGGDHYPDRVKPQLCRDAAGNLFICRRKGNIFTVDTWLRG